MIHALEEKGAGSLPLIALVIVKSHFQRVDGRIKYRHIYTPFTTHTYTYTPTKTYIHLCVRHFAPHTHTHTHRSLQYGQHPPQHTRRKVHRRQGDRPRILRRRLPRSQRQRTPNTHRHQGCQQGEAQEQEAARKPRDRDNNPQEGEAPPHRAPHGERAQRDRLLPHHGVLRSRRPHLPHKAAPRARCGTPFTPGDVRHVPAPNTLAQRSPPGIRAQLPPAARLRPPVPQIKEPRAQGHQATEHAAVHTLDRLLHSAGVPRAGLRGNIQHAHPQDRRLRLRKIPPQQLPRRDALRVPPIHGTRDPQLPKVQRQG